MGRKNSRAKGANGEREFAKLLSDAGFPSRRGQQFSGGSESPDVVCKSLRRFHFEVKRTQQFPYYKALEQSARDATSGNGCKLPLVGHRKNNQPWIILLYASDFLTYIAPLFRHGAQTTFSESAGQGKNPREVPAVHEISSSLAKDHVQEMLAREDIFATYGDK